jgi:threonine dehydratase
VGSRYHLRMKPSTALPFAFSDVEAAAARIKGGVERTPMLHAQTLSNLLGCELWLKFENLQYTASFKERGALNKLSQLTADERARGVIAMSAGNHAQGVAYHGKRLGVPVTIVMPIGTPHVKVRNTQSHGAAVVLFGNSLMEAATHAHALADVHSYTFVHPYDDPLIAAGQGTIAIEMLADAPHLDTLVVPVGGGGMISGMAVAAKHLKPSIEMVGVESERFPALAQARAGAPIVTGGDTIAEGIAVRDIGKLTHAVSAQLLDHVQVVSEVMIERAIVMLLEIEKTVTEGAGATGLAALIAEPARYQGKKVGVVLCGGNIDTRILASVLLKSLARDGRLMRLRLTIPDVSGSLAKVLMNVAEAGGNLIDVKHERLFGDISPKATEVELTLEARDVTHAEQLCAHLEEGGYHPRRI